MHASCLVVILALLLPLPTAAAVLPAAAGTLSRPGSGDEPVNINTADAEQLQRLKGVGPARAAAIISWRRSHGAFRSADDLDQVKGIGPSLVARNRLRITTQ